MSLQRWLPDWYPIKLGIDEKYVKDNFSIHFCEPRPNEEGIGEFTYIIYKNDNMLYSARVNLSEFSNQREKIMTQIREKISDYTKITLMDPISLPLLPIKSEEQKIIDNIIKCLFESSNKKDNDKLKYSLSQIDIIAHNKPLSKIDNDGLYMIICNEAFKGNLEIIEYIMSNTRININKSYDGGVSAIYHATSQGHLSIIKLLIPLTSYIRKYDIINYGLHNFGKPSIHDVGGGVRSNASKYNDRYEQFLETIEYLIKVNTFDNTKVDDPIWTALYINHGYLLGEAVSGNHYRLTKILLMDPNIKTISNCAHDIYRIMFSANWGYFDTLKLLIEDERTNLSEIVALKWPINGIKSNETRYMPLYNALIESARYDKMKGYEQFINYIKSKK